MNRASNEAPPLVVVVVVVVVAAAVCIYVHMCVRITTADALSDELPNA